MLGLRRGLLLHGRCQQNSLQRGYGIKRKECNKLFNLHDMFGRLLQHGYRQDNLLELRRGLLLHGRFKQNGLRQGHIFNSDECNELFNVHGMCSRYV